MRRRRLPPAVLGALGGLPPLPVAPGAPRLWWDGSDADLQRNTTYPSGTSIGAASTPWRDKGSLGLNLTQATAAARPTLQANGAGGRPSVRADGAGDYLRTALFGAALVQPTLVAMVGRAISIASSPIPFSSVDSAAVNQHTIFSTTPAYRLYALVGPLDGGTPVAGQWFMWLGYFNGASTISRVNGVQVAAGATGTSDLNGVTLFASHGGVPAQFFFGDLSEVIVYNGSIPAFADVEAYFTAKYGAFPQ